MALPNISSWRSTWPRWARVASSAWVLSPLLVFALLIGTFFAYGAYTRSKPTHYARGGDSFAVIPDSKSPSPLPTTATDHKQRVTPKASASARAAAPVTSVDHNSGQSSSAGHVATKTTSATGPVYPATGTYQLQVDGQEHVRFGPFSACSNTFPTSSSLVVKPASGEPAGSYDFDHRFYPSNANRHDERHIYRYTKAGVFLGFEEATVTCGGIKQSSTVNFQPAQQRVDLPLSTGATWHTDGGDSGRTEKGSFQVVGQQTISVAGHSYLTWVIDSHVSMSGDETGTRDQRWWWSPDLAIPLKWHESLSGKRSGATYSEDVTVTVVGLP
jgi:hypothetical protein